MTETNRAGGQQETLWEELNRVNNELRRAEELLFGELAVALEIPRDDVPAFIEQRLGSLAAALE